MSEGSKRWTSQLKKREFALPLPFCSIQASKGLDEAHPLWKVNKFYETNESRSHRHKQALNQDGRVEGRVVTPSCENTGITTNC